MGLQLQADTQTTVTILQVYLVLDKNV